MLFKPLCSRCDEQASSIEVIMPDTEPAEWADWSQDRRQIFRQSRKPGEFRFLYEGPGGSNGWVGDVISPVEAERTIAACTSADAAAILELGLYDNAGFCAVCRAFYCPTHWSISSTGFGVCPLGHRKSLDPHWHPEELDASPDS